MNNPQPQPLEKRIKLLQIVAGALFAHSAILVWLTWTFSKQAVEAGTATPSFENPLFQPLAMASVVVVITALVLPNILLAKAAKSRDPWGAVFKSYIIRFALFDAISIWGFMIGRTSSDLNFTYIAFGVTVAGFVVFFPRAEAVKKYMPRDPNQQNPIGV